MLDGKNFRLADEVRYILRRAAEHDGRLVTIGQLVLFSTETGDAWLLDPSDQLAAPLARDGDPEPFHIEQNETTFTIEWKGSYRIEGYPTLYPAFAGSMVAIALTHSASPLAVIRPNSSSKNA